jgi:lysophospholipase L1-like esterase
MKRLLGGSLLLLCLAGTWAAGCSSSKSPAGGTAGATGGNGNGTGGNTGTGGNGGGDSGTMPDAGPQDTAIRTIDPSDTAHLLYSGRIDFTDPTKPSYSAPGATVTAKFTGVSISVMLQDSFKGQNYYDVVVDGTQTFQIQPLSGKTKYDVVSNLVYMEHTVVFVKRTEASQGSVTFLGFEFGGPLLPAPARPLRKIEIIGDSISTGSGDEPGANQINCNTSGGNPAQNAYVSYGAVLARNLNAEYHITAAAGRGVIDNYECGSLDTLPAGYDHMNQRDLSSPLWDHTKYVPDAIIIMLGTNDFSPDQCSKPPISAQCDSVKYQLFISKFEEFISKLRGYYPNVEVFLTSSPMLTDGWPTPVAVGDSGVTCPYTSRTSQIAAITSVVQYFNVDAGDTRVHLVTTIPKGLGRGCGTHPNVTEQLQIGGTPDSINPNAADMLLNPVKTVMGW